MMALPLIEKKVRVERFQGDGSEFAVGQKGKTVRKRLERAMRFIETIPESMTITKPKKNGV